MNKKLLLLPILLTSPLFFMANSPAPAAFPIERYYDFRVDSFSQNDEKNERGYYDFSITIDNFGDNYLLFTNGEFTVKDKYDNYGYTTTENPSDCAINPGKSRTVFGESSVKLNTDELEFVSNVYSSPYQASYDSVTFADKSVNSDGSYDYRFSVNNLKLDDEYYHSFIVDYSYLGEDRSFDIQYYNINSFFITLEEDLEGEDILINKVLVANGRSRRSISINNMWMTIWIVLAILGGMTFIAACIVLPIVIPAAVRKKKAESQEDSGQEK